MASAIQAQSKRRSRQGDVRSSEWFCGRSAVKGRKVKRGDQDDDKCGGHNHLRPAQPADVKPRLFPSEARSSAPPCRGERHQNCPRNDPGHYKRRDHDEQERVVYHAGPELRIGCARRILALGDHATNPHPNVEDAAREEQKKLHTYAASTALGVRTRRSDGARAIFETP